MSSPRFLPWLILATITLASTLYGMSITIANVALPQLQGALSATQDQIAWTVTFNIIGTAVVTPMTGWLSGRFGERLLILAAVCGFALSSILCGFATDLTELIVYRILQGAFGAPLVPLSQAIIFSAFSKHLHATATAIWGMGVVFGPVIGPTVGGYLSEAYNWQWVFFIIAPFSALAFVGCILYIRDTHQAVRTKLDWIGLLSLSMAIAAFQLVLDRGQRLDWFDSQEIVIETAITIACFYVFVIHISTTKTPYLNHRLFLNHNYRMGAFLVFIYGMLNYTPMVLYPPMLQELRGYPDSIIGLLLAVRGVGALIGNFSTIWISRSDPRIGLLLGFGAQAYSCWLLAQFNINMTTGGIALASFIQGLGIGFGWVPLTMVMFSTIHPKEIPEGTAVLHLLRNIGSSIYISVTVSLVVRSTFINYSEMREFITPDNKMLMLPSVSGSWTTANAEGLIKISNEIERQAAMVGYINAFSLLALTGFVTIPFIIMIRKP